MHELGITSRILGIALERAESVGAKRITAVHLEVGEESDVAPESLEHYWPQVSRSTLAEGARLVLSVAEDPWAFRMLAIDVDDDVAVATPSATSAVGSEVSKVTNGT